MLKKNYNEYLDKLNNNKIFIVFKNDNETLIDEIKTYNISNNDILIDCPKDLINKSFEKGSICFLDDTSDLKTLTYDVDINIYYLRYTKYVFKCNTEFTDKNINFNIKQFLVREDLV